MYLYLTVWLMSRWFTKYYDTVILNAGLVGNSILIPIAQFIGLRAIGVAYAEELTMALSGEGLKKRIKRFLLLKCYRRADGFVSVCNFTKNVLISCGVNPERIEIIPPMIGDMKINEKEGPEQRGHEILSVGRLVKRKGFDLLIEAVKLLKEDIPDIHLTIVGKGDEKANLERLVDKCDLERYVSVIGQVSDEELSELYARCSVFVLAHIKMKNGDCEGAPTVFLEAGAYGKPVIGGVEGGADAVIDHGKTGYVIDPQDVPLLARHIKALLLNPDMASAMGMAGRRKIEEHHAPGKASERLYHYLTAMRTGIR
jgi:phosphatidylinositol alpha-1,6-mannosyltransferase